MTVVRIPHFRESIFAHLEETIEKMKGEDAAKAVYMLTIDGDGDLSFHMIGSASEFEALGAFDIARDMIKSGMNYD